MTTHFPPHIADIFPRILVVVDLQHDFVVGKLATDPPASVLQHVTDLMHGAETVVATQDWHPGDHCSFEHRGGPWPSHCVAGTRGARLLAPVFNRADVVVRKGTRPDEEEYSAVARHKQHFPVGARYTVVGIATDYCVKQTALDLHAHAVSVEVDLRGCQGVSPDTAAQAIEEMRQAGVGIVG